MAVMRGDTMKLCPFCVEEIQDAAIVCKHCGRDLPETRPSEPHSARVLPAARAQMGLARGPRRVASLLAIGLGSVLCFLPDMGALGPLLLWIGLAAVLVNPGKLLRWVVAPFLTLVLWDLGHLVVRYSQPEAKVVFAPKDVWDTGGEGDVYVSGTLTGEGVVFENNSTVVYCRHDPMECVTYYTGSTSPNSVARLDAPSYYPVTTWRDDEVVAAVVGECFKETISILRKTKTVATVVWVREPINQSSAYCKDWDTRLLKWTIEDPPNLNWKIEHPPE